MNKDQVATFAQSCTDVQASIDAVVGAIDGLRELTDAVSDHLRGCTRAVSVLRRTNDAEMMGPLNSLSAAHARQQSLAGALSELEAALAKFEDVARDLRLLQPTVVDALNEKLTPKAPVDPAAPVDAVAAVKASTTTRNDG